MTWEEYFFRVEGATERAMSVEACSCKCANQPVFVGSVHSEGFLWEPGSHVASA